MQVFKLCGKVMWKNRFVLILYLAMFLMMALITAAAFYNSGQATGYAAEKTDIAFFAEEDTPLVEGLRAQPGQGLRVGEIGAAGGLDLGLQQALAPAPAADNAPGDDRAHR